MKQMFFLICILAATLVCAQENMFVKDDFESNRLRWDEYYEKGSSASIREGNYVIENSVEGSVARGITEFPIDLENNFKITAKLLIPNLNDSYYFGVVFDYKDENNYSSFLVSEKKFRILNRVSGVNSFVRRGAIVLNSGKNKEVTIEMEKKGKRLIFNVDNMEAIVITKKLDFSAFGFEVEHKNTIKVTEVLIEQLSRYD